MATLRIWETVRASYLPIIRVDERMNYQAVTFTGAQGVSAAFDADTSVITIVSDVACAVAIGAAPVATANSYPLAANTLLDIEVQPGAKISAITTA